MDLDLSVDIEKLFFNLVSIKSDTGTTLESDVEEYIYNHLKSIEYFNDNPDYFGMYKLENDSLNRSAIWGLVKGNSNDTIILMHHHDVVDENDYGNLRQYAYSPDILKDKLSEIDLDEESFNDLNSEWIFGRGTADMKGGAAIQIALLEYYSKLEDFNGNVLLLSVPDEENLSLGMREGVNLLYHLKEKFNLDYKLLINSEPHIRENIDEGIVYEGSVGKIMPVIYVRGKQTHVGEIYKGFNPILLLSEIVKMIELNVDFSDVYGSEIAPPPSFINFRDRKVVYDVSSPKSAAGYFSILPLQTTPKDIIYKLINISKEAFFKTTEHIKSSHKRYVHKVNKFEEFIDYNVNVKTFNEIYDEAVKTNGNKFIDDYKVLLNNISDQIKNNKINLQESSILLIEKTLEYINDLSPIVIISLAPPYYPSVSNKDMNNLSNSILNLSDNINEYTLDKYNEKYIKKNYFMGISDMSYTNISNINDNLEVIGPNMPLWNEIYKIEFEKIGKLSIPVINIGPWGKDLHKYTERVNKKDLLYKTPSIIDYAIRSILKINNKGE